MECNPRGPFSSGLGLGDSYRTTCVAAESYFVECTRVLCKNLVHVHSTKPVDIPCFGLCHHVDINSNVTPRHCTNNCSSTLNDHTSGDTCNKSREMIIGLPCGLRSDSLTTIKEGTLDHQWDSLDIKGLALGCQSEYCTISLCHTTLTVVVSVRILHCVDTTGVLGFKGSKQCRVQCKEEVVMACKVSSMAIGLKCNNLNGQTCGSHAVQCNVFTTAGSISCHGHEKNYDMSCRNLTQDYVCQDSKDQVSLIQF